MRRALLAVAGLIVLALIAAQLLLPGVAEQRLKSDLERQASAVEVSVKAFPAVKLLFGHADDVTIDIANLRPDEDRRRGRVAAGPARRDAQGRQAGRSRQGARGPPPAHRGRAAEKERQRAHRRRALRKSDVDAALPAELELVDREVPNGLAVAGSTDVFGELIEAEANIFADDDGSLVLEPSDDLLGELVSVPIFEDDRVAVDSISAQISGDIYIVTARGHLR